MSEPVQQGTSKPFRSKDLRPFLEGQVCRHHKAVMLIGLADDLEEQFGSGLGEGNISQFINHQEMESLELFVHSLKPLFFPALHELSHKVRGRMEADVFPLGTGGEREGADQVGFAGSGVSDQQDVFFFVQVLSPQELPYQGFINGGLGAEVIGVDGFDHGEIGIFDAPFGSSFLPVQQFPLRQA